MNDLRKAAQPEQEPVAWMYEWNGDKHLTFTDQRWIEKAHPHFNKSAPLYTAPPQRKPLTNGEIYTAYITATNQTLRAQDERLALEFARAVERAHGIGGDV